MGFKVPEASEVDFPVVVVVTAVAAAAAAAAAVEDLVRNGWDRGRVWYWCIFVVCDSSLFCLHFPIKKQEKIFANR